MYCRFHYIQTAILVSKDDFVTLEQLAQLATAHRCISGYLYADQSSSIVIYLLPTTPMPLAIVSAAICVPSAHDFAPLTSARYSRENPGQLD